MVLGFNWFLGNMTNAIRNPLATNGSRATNAPGLVGILNDDQFRRVINALDQRDGIDLLSMPRTTTMSGKLAHLAVEDIDIAGRPQTNSFAPGPTVDVIPRISEDGFSSPNGPQGHLHGTPWI